MLSDLGTVRDEIEKAIREKNRTVVEAQQGIKRVSVDLLVTL